MIIPARQQPHQRISVVCGRCIANRIGDNKTIRIDDDFDTGRLRDMPSVGDKAVTNIEHRRCTRVCGCWSRGIGRLRYAMGVDQYTRGPEPAR